jgi:hypothetical protein
MANVEKGSRVAHQPARLVACAVSWEDERKKSDAVGTCDLAAWIWLEQERAQGLRSPLSPPTCRLEGLAKSWNGGVAGHKLIVGLGPIGLRHWHRASLEKCPGRSL